MTIEFQGYTFTTEQAVVYGLIAVGVLLALYWVLFTRTNHLPVTSHTTLAPPDPGATSVTTTNSSAETAITTVAKTITATSAGVNKAMDLTKVTPTVTPALTDTTVASTETVTDHSVANSDTTTNTTTDTSITNTTTDTSITNTVASTTTPVTLDSKAVNTTEQDQSQAPTHAPTTMDHQALQQVPQELGKNLTPQAQEAHQQQFGENLPPTQSEQILSIYEQIDSGKLKIAKYARAYLCILMLGYLLKNTGKATTENAQELENYTIAVFLHAFKPALFNYNTNEIVHDQQVRDNANLLIKQCHYYYSWGMNAQTDQEVMLEFIDALALQLLPVEHSYEDILYQSLNVYNVYKKVFRIYSYVTGQNLPDTPSNHQVLDHLKHKFKLEKFKFEAPFF